MSASDFLTALGTGSGLPRAACVPAMTLRFTEVRCRAAHMGAALQGIFVGQGPFALPGSAEKLGSGRCGERTERCRWQRKRSERVAAVKISSVRRKAAQKIWAPQQGHRPLRIMRGQGRPPLQDAGDLAARTVRAIAGVFGSTPAIGWFRSISAACDGCRQHPDPSGLSRDPSPGT